jgi:hypothetical protein
MLNAYQSPWLQLALLSRLCSVAYMLIRVFAFNLACLSDNLLALWSACSSVIRVLACSFYKAYQIMCLYRGLHAYQSLCLQLGNCMHKHMLAGVPDFQILCLPATWPANQILCLYLGVLIRFYASS